MDQHRTPAAYVGLPCSPRKSDCGRGAWWRVGRCPRGQGGEELFLAREAPDGTLVLGEVLPSSLSAGPSTYAWVGPDRLEAWAWLQRADGGTTGPTHLSLTIGDEDWETIGRAHEADTYPDFGPQDSTSPYGGHEITVEWADGDQRIVTLRAVATGAAAELRDARSPIGWLDGALAYSTGSWDRDAGDSRVLLRRLG